MFGSAAPQKPQTRQKRKGKPPWSDPSTRVTVARSVVVTVTDPRHGQTTIIIPKTCTREVLSAVLFAFRPGRKGGAR